MAPGFQRYALLLTLMTAGTIGTVGCSGGGHGGGGFFASVGTASGTTASTTSATTGAVATNQGPGPVITTAIFEDKDNDGKASKGDRIKLGFSGMLVAKAQQVDANTEFALSVQGDSFGTGAIAMPDGQLTNTVYVILGDNPKLRISGVFDANKTGAGEASGVDVAKAPAGNFRHNTDDSPIAASAARDVEGTLAVGFRNGPSMVSAHGGAEAVTLDDGRVLVVGGLKGTNNYAEDAEVFDPVANQFTQVRDLSGPDKGRMMNDKIVVRRINHTATKLKDGRVLIAGGYGYQKKGGILSFLGLGKEKLETLDVAHVFDPKTNTFSKVGTMKNDRHSHTATLLADGRVLIAGGYSDSWWSRNATEAPFEAFDPKSNSFSQYHHWLIFTNKTQEKRQSHAAVALDGGARVLLSGGEHWEGGWLHWFGKNTLKLNKSSEVFVASKNETTKSGDMKRARRRQAAAPIGTNAVLVAGGYDDKAVVPTIETWDGNSNAWTERGTLKFPRTNARIENFGSTSENLIIGGYTFGGQAAGDVADVEVYDQATGTLSAPGYKLATGRNSPATVKLLDGRIMVIGGFVGTQKNVQGFDGQALATTEIFAKP